MPKFELVGVGNASLEEIVRARTPEQAIRQWAELDQDRTIEIETERDFDRYKGWRVVKIDGQEVGRIRSHHRMQFRRD